MKALVWTAPREAVVRDEPMPGARDGEVILAVRAAGICGSDLHGYRGESPLRVPPLILGHEVVGADERGTEYVVNPLVACGRCALCSAGTPNLCPQRGLLGLDRPGAFAEHIRVRADSLTPLPASMSPVLGTLVEPLATPVNALRTTPLEEGSTVVVIGAGPIGLLACYASRRRGVSLVACYDLDAGRVEVAGAFADAVGTSAADIRDAVLDASGGVGAHLVVDAVGVEPTWNEAFELVRPGGAIAEVGLAQAEGGAPVGALVRNGVTWRGVYAYTPTDFAEALSLLATDPPSRDWVARFGLEQGPEVLQMLADGMGPVKAVFEL